MKKVDAKKSEVRIVFESAEGLRWSARGGGIARMGPFRTQVEATRALVLVDRTPNGEALYPQNAFVWPEATE